MRLCRGVVSAGLTCASLGAWGMEPDTEAPAPAPWHLPSFATEGGGLTMQPGGRLHLDMVQFDNDAQGARNASGIQVRRGWINLIGKASSFDCRVSVDFADNQYAFKSVYVRHRLGNGTLTIGQFKPFFSLDDTISSDDMVFMERAFVAITLAPLFRLGASYLGQAGNTTYGVAVFSLNDIDDVRANGSGQTLRLTWSPLRDNGNVTHLGVSLANENYAGSSASGELAATLAVTPAGAKSVRSRARFLRLRNGAPTHVQKYAIEFAQNYGAWSFQAEYGGARYDDDIDRAGVRTYYAQASYFLTGETRPYNRAAGKFDSLTPRSAHGAWEVAARYDHIDGHQHSRAGGLLMGRAVHATTLGLNWYRNENMRLMFNFVDARVSNRIGAQGDERVQALEARFQFIF